MERGQKNRQFISYLLFFSHDCCFIGCGNFRVTKVNSFRVQMLLRSLRHKKVHDLIGLHEVIGIEDSINGYANGIKLVVGRIISVSSCGSISLFILKYMANKHYECIMRKAYHIFIVVVAEWSFFCRLLEL